MEFYKKQGANILQLIHKRTALRPNPFKFAYQRGDSNGNFEEFMEKLNTENPLDSDNNNNIPTKKVKNALKFTRGLKKAVEGTEMERKRNDAVYAIDPDNAIREKIEELRDNVKQNITPNWRRIKSVLDMLIRNDEKLRNYVALQYKEKLTIKENSKGEMTLSKVKGAWKKDDNDGKSPTEQWWDILNDVLDQLNTLPSSVDWFGLGYRLPKFPKLFEELSLDLEHIWDYAEDTSIPEPMTFGLAARKAKQFNVFQ
jgi:hypothetical protein